MADKCAFTSLFFVPRGITKRIPLSVFEQEQIESGILPEELEKNEKEGGEDEQGETENEEEDEEGAEENAEDEDHSDEGEDENSEDEDEASLSEETLKKKLRELEDEEGSDLDLSEEEEEGGEGDGKGEKGAKKKKPKTLEEEFDLDNYDNDDSNPDNDDTLMNVFSMSKEDREAALADPLLGDEVDEDSEDDEDNDIKETDQVFVAASAEDENCNLEVFVYDENESSMWVHHDLMLNAYPLCMDWVSSCGGKKGNFAAVGQFDCNIDIWDLNVTDAMRPVLTLGRGDGSDRYGENAEEEDAEEDDAGEEDAEEEDAVNDSDEERPRKKKKLTGGLGVSMDKKKSKKSGSKKSGSKISGGGSRKVQETAHSGAVMCLNTNPIQSAVLASGSADHTVKLWDLNNGSCVQTFNHHSSKVQCVKWHRTEESVLLTAAYDKSVCLMDVRTNLPAAKMTLSADAENAIWNNQDPNLCYVSTEDGKVFCYDARRLASSAASPSLWTIQAYENGACSGLAQANRVLVTGGTDGVAKVWDLYGGSQENQFSTSAATLEFAKNLSAGPLFCCAGADAYRGSKVVKMYDDDSNGNSNSRKDIVGDTTCFIFGGNNVALWDLRSERNLCEKFGWEWEGVSEERLQELQAEKMRKADNHAEKKSGSIRTMKRKEREQRKEREEAELAAEVELKKAKIGEKKGKKEAKKEAKKAKKSFAEKTAEKTTAEVVEVEKKEAKKEASVVSVEEAKMEKKEKKGKKKGTKASPEKA